MNKKEIKNRIENEYFVYNGVKYYAGTKFKMKKGTGVDRDDIIIADFQGYDIIHKGKLSVHYKGRNGYYQECDEFVSVTREEIKNMIIEIVPGNYYTELEARKRHPRDSDILEITVGWVIYIIIMLGLVIFNDRVAGWIATTIFFFVWRHKKLEDEYYYYE